MGVLDRFEKGIERAVNGAFAKAFRSEVQPVEIASALRREVDDKAAIVGRDRTIAPNTFVVELGPADHDRLGQWTDALGDELSSVIADHARQQRYAFVGPITVRFEQADDLDTGLFRVRSTTTRRDGAHAAASPGPPPPAGPVGASPRDYQRPPAAPAWPPSGTWQPTNVPPSLELDGRRIELTRPVTLIGRGTEADVVLDDPGVSRRHAEIHLVESRARVVDLASTNGTFVDGEKQPAATLREGSIITVGRTRMTYHDPERRPGAPDARSW